MSNERNLKHVRDLFESNVEEYDTPTFAQLAGHGSNFFLLDDRGISDTRASAGMDTVCQTYQSVYFNEGTPDDVNYELSDSKSKCAYYRELFGKDSNFHVKSSNIGVSMDDACLHLAEQISGPAGKVVAIERADVIEEL